MRARVAAAVLAIAAAAPSAGFPAARPRLEQPRGLAAASSPLVHATTTLGASGMRLLASSDWNGGRFQTSGGVVTIYVSPAYAADQSAAQQWADFFASLVHGPELGLLTAYFAPPEEVQSLCGGEGDAVLGCYASNRLVAIGETTDGITPESVAAHEYGHHVAGNRANSPWVAIDWGPKRWATKERVCSRAADGTAFPGDESLLYGLNPGEAWAESFRVLNETRGGAPETWPLLDPSFMPDAAALQAVEDDVVSPWAASPPSTVRGRFTGGRGVWTRRISTPLDGTLTITLAGGSNGLQVLDAHGRTVLARGSWTSGGGQQAETTICGQRSLVVRVARGGRAQSFALRISQP
jgi:hypothetical protein